MQDLCTTATSESCGTPLDGAQACINIQIKVGVARAIDWERYYLLGSVHLPLLSFDSPWFAVIFR